MRSCIFCWPDGAGFPGGSGSNYGETGAGALVILIVWGNLLVNLNGQLLSRGCNGGLGKYMRKRLLWLLS